jgi:uncharacterized membrane protein
MGDTKEKPRRERARAIVRVLLALAMVGVGIDHLADPTPFVNIVPKELPAPLVLVYVSGVCEIALGVGLLVPKIRRLAGYGLVALYVAVFPANINMAVRGLSPNPEHPIPSWIAWARLPFQILFIALALWVSKRPNDANDPR